MVIERKKHIDDVIISSATALSFFGRIALSFS